MTDKDKLKLLIDAIDYSFWNPVDKDYNKELTYPVIDKVKYIKRLIMEEPVSEDFETEWQNYFKYRGDVATVNIKDLARHFANWQKQQMMKDAVESEVEITSKGILLPNLKIEDFGYADKVRVIVIKDE